jgi:hypothetical protein
MTTMKTRLFLSRHGDADVTRNTQAACCCVNSVGLHRHSNQRKIQLGLDGGTVVTELSPNIKVNEESALHRMDGAQ